MCGCPDVPPGGDLALTQACTLTGNRTGDPLVHRLALSPLSHTSQGTSHILYVIEIVLYLLVELYILN